MGYGVVLLLFGAVSLAAPKLWWSLSKWQYRHPEANEPSEAAFALARLGGAVMVAIGIWFVAEAASEGSKTAKAAKIESKQTTDPVAYLDEMFSRVVREKATNLPSRGDLRIQARLSRVNVKVGEELALLRQVELSMRDDSPKGVLDSGPHWCATFPAQGPPTITPQGCPYSDAGLEAARDIYRKIILTAYHAHRSPRDPAVFTEAYPNRPPEPEFSPGFAQDGKVSFYVSDFVNYGETRCLTFPEAVPQGKYSTDVVPGEC